MRIFLIENFSEREFDVSEPEQFDALIEYAKQNCSKAINEFYKTDNFLYRGISGIDGEKAFVVKTKERRKSFGSSMKGKTGASFNNWLEKNGHVRRDQKVAFATTEEPKNYRGIKNDHWFIFLPVGNYSYTYINTPHGSDFNYHPWVREALGTFYYFEDMCNELEGMLGRARLMIQHLERKHVDVFEDSIAIGNIVEKFDEVKAEIQKMIMDIAMIYQKGIFEDDGYKSLKPYMKKLHSFVTQFENISAMMASAENVLDEDSDEYTVLNSHMLRDSLHEPYVHVRNMDRNIDVGKTFTLMDALMQMFISNTITPNIKENEVFVQCGSYLVVPYALSGEFIQRVGK